MCVCVLPSTVPAGAHGTIVVMVGEECRQSSSGGGTRGRGRGRGGIGRGAHASAAGLRVLRRGLGVLGGGGVCFGDWRTAARSGTPPTAMHMRRDRGFQAAPPPWWHSAPARCHGEGRGWNGGSWSPFVIAHPCNLGFPPDGRASSASPAAGGLHVALHGVPPSRIDSRNDGFGRGGEGQAGYRRRVIARDRSVARATAPSPAPTMTGVAYRAPQG